MPDVRTGTKTALHRRDDVHAGKANGTAGVDVILRRALQKVAAPINASGSVHHAFAEVTASHREPLHYLPTSSSAFAHSVLLPVVVATRNVPSLSEKLVRRRRTRFHQVGTVGGGTTGHLPARRRRHLL